MSAAPGREPDTDAVEESAVDERPQRRREYSGAGSTLGLAALIIIVVGLGVWFLEFRGPGESGANDAYGIVALPEALNPTGEAATAAVGRAAPNFVLQDVDGSEVTLTDLRGEHVLVNFWASWCAPCKAETPALQSLHEDRPDDLVVVGINMQEPPDTARAFAEQFAVSYPIVLDRDGDVTNAYRLTGPPTSFLIDAEGVIVAIFIGELTAEHFDQITGELVG